MSEFDSDKVALWKKVYDEIFDLLDDQTCPHCKTEHLKMVPGYDNPLHFACGSCGHSWDPLTQLQAKPTVSSGLVIGGLSLRQIHVHINTPITAHDAIKLMMAIEKTIQVLVLPEYVQVFSTPEAK